MRKLGEALDADPTAIYRHFRSKDELLRAVGDRCLIGVTDDLPDVVVARLHPRAVHPDPGRQPRPTGAGDAGARRSSAARQRAADHRDDARQTRTRPGFGAESAALRLSRVDRADDRLGGNRRVAGVADDGSAGSDLRRMAHRLRSARPRRVPPIGRDGSLAVPRHGRRPISHFDCAARSSARSGRPALPSPDAAYSM